MHILVLAHPWHGSFNYAIARARNTLGHHVSFRDLYVERFDPVMPPELSRRAAPILSHFAEVEVHASTPNW